MKNICYCPAGTQDVSKPLFVLPVFGWLSFVGTCTYQRKKYFWCLVFNKNQNQGTLSVPLLAPKSFCTTTMVITTKQMMSWFPMPTWRPVNKAKPWAATALINFTVNPGAYRLKVVTGDPLLGFPSTRFSVQNTQGTGDSYGDALAVEPW